MRWSFFTSKVHRAFRGITERWLVGFEEEAEMCQHDTGIDTEDQVQKRQVRPMHVERKPTAVEA